MSGHDPDLDAERRQEAGRWLAVATADMRVMRMCLDAAEPEAGIAAYLRQQAAEKLVKGLLVVAGVAFARTHDMARLGDLAASHYPALRDVVETTGRPTARSYAYRYPGVEEAVEPSPTVLREALETVEEIAARLRALGVSERYQSRC
jgi:HEPN domain-containing protein